MRLGLSIPERPALGNVVVIAPKDADAERVSDSPEKLSVPLGAEAGSGPLLAIGPHIPNAESRADASVVLPDGARSFQEMSPALTGNSVVSASSSTLDILAGIASLSPPISAFKGRGDATGRHKDAVEGAVDSQSRTEVKSAGVLGTALASGLSSAMLDGSAVLEGQKVRGTTV